MRRPLKYLTIFAVLIFSSVSWAENRPECLNIETGLKQIDKYTIIAEKNFLTGYEPTNPDGTINAVIEIPTGSTAKWEVMKPDGALVWEFKYGKPRVVQYLGYPGNYGMIPRTVYSAKLGGDQDPLDVLVLGPPVCRGAVVKVKAIGVLRMLDNKERDDKIIAVMSGTPFFELNDISELEKKYAGVTGIIKTWFLNYKGKGIIEIEGYGDASLAKRIIRIGAAEYIN